MNPSNVHLSSELVGIASDEVPAILATGRSGVTTMFVSMSKRHPHGDDAQYLRWHTLDHRPEQYRLASLKASLRLVSTPACRAARAASNEQFDAVDHVMTYFFGDFSDLKGFGDLAVALADAGRMPYLLPAVQRGVYEVQARVAAPRIKAGADVLPWWPARGLYMLIESGTESAAGLAEVPGVAGVWSGQSVPTVISDAQAGQRMSYCFLDDDPVATAKRLLPVLKQRWQTSTVQPLFAAPFYVVIPHEWDRYVP